MSEKRISLKRWVGRTFFGWLLGFVFVLLGSIIGEALKLREGSQSIVGIAMGAGVGITQYFVARSWFEANKIWIWGSLIGLASPFIVFDLLAPYLTVIPVWLSLQVKVLIGGLLVGFIQKRTLPVNSSRSKMWPVICAFAWTLSAWTVALTGPLMSLRGAWVALLNLSLILFGGVVLGIVTGKGLFWILQEEQQD